MKSCFSYRRGTDNFTTGRSFKHTSRPAVNLPLPIMSDSLPYRIACLCDLRDADGRILLIHRERSPNKGLCSPIGGKLDMHTGESPAQCARREIMEEAGVEIPIERLHLGGLISETAFEGAGHWLLFYYRVLGPVEVPEQTIPEGRLAWHHADELESLPLPDSDRKIIWPMIRRHDTGGERPGFFALHIDCGDDGLTWSVEESFPPGA